MYLYIRGLAGICLNSNTSKVGFWELLTPWQLFFSPPDLEKLSAGRKSGPGSGVGWFTALDLEQFTV